MELVWDVVREEEECFWVNLREDNKVSENKMAVSESKMAEFKMASHHLVESEWMNEVPFVQNVRVHQWQEFKMAAIIKLSQNEWVKFFLCKMVESMMAEFKVAAIIKLSENEWVWVRLN